MEIIIRMELSILIIRINYPYGINILQPEKCGKSTFTLSLFLRRNSFIEFEYK